MKDTYDNYIASIDKLGGLDDLQKNQLKEDWVGFMRVLEKLCNRHFIYYNILNISGISSGILVPVLINVASEFDWIKPVATTLSVIAALSAALSQSYKFNSRWQHFRMMTERARIEGSKYLALCGTDYRGKTHQQALALFIERINELRTEQMKTFFSVIQLTTNVEKKEDMADNKGPS